MQRSQKRGPPKHLEKMLFINHKEDLMLDDKLDHLNLRSRQKIMELDLERIKVRNEWRNSRKKNITMSEAISSGILPPEPVAAPVTIFRNSSHAQPQKLLPQRQDSMTNKRMTASAPPRRKMGVAQQKLPRGTTFFREPGHGRDSMLNSFPKQPVIQEHEELPLHTTSDILRKKDLSDTVGTYVLDEFEKVSQVVPDILRALAKKKEQYEEEKEKARIAHDLKSNEKVDLMEYEPDMNKVRKTVSSVKKLRHRMAISKKLEVSKPKMSFDQMVKDRTGNIGEYDEFTDGMCVLMKRKLDKKRRDSAPALMEGEMFQRRQSLLTSSVNSMPRRMSSLPGMDQSQRRGSNFAMAHMQKHGSLGQDSDTGATLIDEDELVNRQRIFREFSKYQYLQGKVDRFLLQRRPGSRTIQTVIEELTPFQ